ncbi:MAG: class I SAM-dependent methyltransferase [Bacteroidia bacterium]|nr:class I SAM-dependent methyltransferase [Bacteroidia bacterium]
MFEQYPKQRPPLPPAYRELYEHYYLLNRKGNSKATSLASRMEAWMHHRIAHDMQSTKPDVSTLEIGAGTLNQLAYVTFDQAYDIVEPFTALYKDSEYLPRIRNIYDGIDQIPAGQHYNNIISIAVLEHLEDMPAQVAMAALHLCPGGHFLAAIPNEGTVLWWLGWNLSTGLEFRLRYNLSYRTLMKHEHVNTAKEIDDALHYFFGTVNCHVFGLLKQLALYRYYHCSNPDNGKCHDYLDSLS